MAQTDILSGGVQAPPVAKSAGRDPRIDVFRGISLLMIFVDHMPLDTLNRFTLHNYAFCDAAEAFVLLAGYSATLAYGRAIARDGWWAGVSRIAQRCGRIYLVQLLLLIATLLIVRAWTAHFHQEVTIMRPVLVAPVSGLLHGVLLAALPSYLDILPLYIVLLAGFPLVYLAMGVSPYLALGGSGLIWLFAGLHPGFNLPNWIDHQGWYFDPLAWQFLFTIGAVLARLASARGGDLPWFRWLGVACALYIAVAAVESFAWTDWHLPDPRPLALSPLDKSHLAWPRILEILALSYLLLASSRMRTWAGRPVFRAIDLCGRHSLEVFAVGCMMALLGRLAFRTAGDGLVMQVAVNVAGMGAMIATAFWLHRTRTGRAGSLASWPSLARPFTR